MRSTYVDHEHCAYRVDPGIAGFVVCASLNGQTAEAIAEAFPLVTQGQVHGALGYHLAHREKIDAYPRQGSQDFERLRQTARYPDPMWYYKLEEARRSVA